MSLHALLDSCILVYLVDDAPNNRARRAASARAVDYLIENGETFAVLQTLAEFWVAATRPKNVNGLGLTTEQAERSLKTIMGWITLLDLETEPVHTWFDLVVQHRVRGKRTHDTRLVAVMLENDIPYLITRNLSDFEAFEKRGITALDPGAVLPYFQSHS